jgi:type IV pilus assembly protein PilV
MKKHSGFTLIEVLIAMIILAVGLLGLAGLQATSLRNNQSAYNRSQATQLAYDIADRIRSNVDDANNYATSTYITVASTAAVIQTDCDSISTTCTTADMAQNDLFQWNAALAAALPSGGTASITVALMGTINVYTIAINWDDNRDDAVNAGDPNFQMNFQL